MSDRPLPPHLDPRRRSPSDRALPPELDPRGRSRRRRARVRGRDDAAPAIPSTPGAPPPWPPAPGRTQRRPWLKWIAGGTALAVLVAAVAVLGIAAYYESRIERVAVEGLGQGVDVDGDDVNYLLVGSDSRRGLTEEELRAARTTAKEDDGALTDTILLVHAPADGSPATFVSFPRDAWVDIPGSGPGRINSAYAIGERAEPGGGPSRLVQTVSQLTGLTIDHYLEVGFVAFMRITEALGGVEVNLCTAQREPDSGIDLPAGVQRLDGGDALAFVRQRKGLPRGDLDRVARQQYFLGAVLRETLSWSTLLQPWQLKSLLDAVTSSVRADEDLGILDLARLGWRLRGVDSGGVQFRTVPIANPNATRGGASVVLLDEAALPGFFAGLSPESTASAAAQTAALTVPPSAIRLEVHNGTTRNGLAASAAERLRDVGFAVSGIGTAARQDQGETVVRHGANRADSAQTVAAAVPGARTELDDSVGPDGLVLVLGGQYSGVRPVQVAPPASAQPVDGAPTAGAPAQPAQAADPAATEQPCIA